MDFDCENSHDSELFDAMLKTALVESANSEIETLSCEDEPVFSPEFEKNVGRIARRS